MSDLPAGMHDEIMSRLNEVLDPCSVATGSPIGLVDMGLVNRVEITSSGAVDVFLQLDSPACYLVGYLQIETTRLVSACEGVTAVTVHPDDGLDWSPRLMAPHVRAERDRRYVNPPLVTSAVGPGRD